MQRISLRTSDCSGCGRCTEICRRGVLRLVDDGPRRIAAVADATACRGCRACERSCPVRAIEVRRDTAGRPLRRTVARRLPALLQLALPAALGLLWLSERPWGAIDWWRLLGLFVLCHLVLYHLPCRFTRKSDSQ